MDREQRILNIISEGKESIESYFVSSIGHRQVRTILRELIAELESGPVYIGNQLAPLKGTTKDES